MISREYNGIKLKLYDSLVEYEKEEGCEFVWEDADGNILLDTKTESVDTANAEAKEHFADDSEYTPHPIDWFASTHKDPEQYIIAILLSDISEISHKEIHTTVGHELGHLSDGDDFQNSTEPYETPEGYTQEETKGQRFEKFSLDNYNITKLFVDMFIERGIKITH